MPVSAQGYRSYTGGLRARGRWFVVLEQELRVLTKSRLFLVLILCAQIHVILRMLQVVTYDIVMQDPNNPLTPLLGNIAAIRVSARMFFDFVTIQSPITFLMIVYAGSGMICNDFRNNLTEVYFSKPLTWRDYLLGKLLTLVLIGLCATALPGVFLVALHNFLLARWDVLADSWWWIPALLAYSLAVVIPSAAAVLGASAAVQSERLAGIVMIMLPLASSGLGIILAELSLVRNYLILSLPFTVQRVGQAVFQERFPAFPLHWGYAIGLLAAISLIALWIAAHRVRRAETAA